jgi:hypothetical protein
MYNTTLGCGDGEARASEKSDHVIGKKLKKLRRQASKSIRRGPAAADSCA